jgi:hypothetical protein
MKYLCLYNIPLNNGPVSIVTVGWMAGSISGRCKIFHHVVQTGSGPHPASYQMGTGGRVIGL